MDKIKKISGNRQPAPRFPHWPTGWSCLTYDPATLPDNYDLLIRLLDEQQRLLADLILLKEQKEVNALLPFTLAKTNPN